MKRALRWILIILAVLLFLSVTLFLFRDPLLREFVEYHVERETGVEASIGSLHLDLLNASIRVTDFTLHNPPGFGGGPMLRMPEIFIRVDHNSPAGGLRLHQAWVNVAEFNIIKSAAGQTNVFALEKRLRKKKERKSDDTDVKFRGIGELKITLGTVRYIDLQTPAKSQEFRINLQDEVVTTINSEDDLEKWATALLIRIAIQQALEKSQEKRGNLLDLLQPPNQ
jgi:hypothetical protein